MPEYALPFDPSALLNSNIECKRPIEDHQDFTVSINMRQHILEMLNMVYSYLLTSMCILLTVIVSLFMVFKILNSKLGQMDILKK